MDIYKQKSTWKIILAVAGILILLVTLFYSNYLADKLAENEEKNVKLFVEALRSTQKSLGKEDEDYLNSDQSLYLDIVQLIDNIPVILENESGQLDGQNYPEGTELDSSFLESEKLRSINNGHQPIDGPGGYAEKIYYNNSLLYTRITYFPLVQVGLILLFVGLGYYLFNTSRRAEQNKVWAGMAKETAHQLGTPISAIMAWIEHLKLSNLSLDQSDIIKELGNDVKRLELIAERFSKIGSTPSLHRIDLSMELEKCRLYMHRRKPSRLELDFTRALGQKWAMINEHLFDWVIENLIRNALDSMDNHGTISARTYDENDYVCIDIEDTGKGIPISKFNTVFQPGYSTKKRGWGLGLSLAKRIIEDYHNGKIFVKHSKIDEGTCFTIKLPRTT